MGVFSFTVQDNGWLQSDAPTRTHALFVKPTLLQLVRKDKRMHWLVFWFFYLKMTDYALTAAENKQGWQDRPVAPDLDLAIAYLTAAAPRLCCLKPKREHSNADKVMMGAPMTSIK